MKKLFILLALTSLLACSTTKTAVQEESAEATYGFSKKNPIKVGGENSGPANERNFLSSLSGPNGEAIWYNRMGSCCQFKTKNSSFGMGMLDIYKVTYEGKKDTLTLYLNMYDKAKLKAPIGFKFKQ